MDVYANFFTLILEVFFIDLLLSGDNAIVIALACRRLPSEQMNKVIAIGTVLAIIMRALLSVISSFIMLIPTLKLFGGVILIIIALKLAIDEEDEADGKISEPTDMLSALKIVLLADLVMSVDNVVALAAISQGDVLVLIIGLLFSVPLLMYGSVALKTLINEYPFLIRIGAGLLGWVGGSVAVADPIFTDFIKSQAQALPYITPALTALFVYIRSGSLKS